MAAGSWGEVPRILLTTVMCLSDYAQKVACCVAASLLCSLLQAFHLSLLTSHSILPAELRNDSQHSWLHQLVWLVGTQKPDLKALGA